MAEEQIEQCWTCEGWQGKRGSMGRCVKLSSHVYGINTYGNYWCDKWKGKAKQT